MCFTYGTWFGIEALAALGETFENSPVHVLPQPASYRLSIGEDGNLEELEVATFRPGPCFEKHCGTIWPITTNTHIPCAVTHPAVHHVQAVQRACDFLLHVQRQDGGWGESYLSCVDKVYTQLEGDTSHVVNSAWGLLSLVNAGYRVRAPLDR